MDQFVFVCCQVGAEKALKQDVARLHPPLAFSFSRPGFVTFKVSGVAEFDITQPLLSPFARTFGHSIGTVKDPADQIQAVTRLFPAHPYRHLHVWYRDQHVPGDHNWEPFHSPASLALAERLRAAATGTPLEKVAINRTAKRGDFVADLIVVDPNLWLAGWHQATTIPSRWPGGVPPLRPHQHMISRAYLKMQEAMRWSRLPFEKGDLCAEIGSSPGGACQALLEKGLHVMGIDPALMDERILSHPNFTHLRARAADLKRKEFARVRWLMADANIAPGNTLADIEHIVTNRRVGIQGMLLTLKLLDWDHAVEIDSYLARIRSWGYRSVRARQLAFNRRELCVAVAKSKGRLKFGRRPKS